MAMDGDDPKVLAKAMEEVSSQKDREATMSMLAACTNDLQQVQVVKELYERDPDAARRFVAQWKAKGIEIEEAFSFQEAVLTRGPDPMPEALEMKKRVDELYRRLSSFSEGHNRLVADTKKRAGLEKIEKLDSKLEELLKPHFEDLVKWNEAVKLLVKPRLLPKDVKRLVHVLPALVTSPKEWATLRDACGAGGVLTTEIDIGNITIPEGAVLLREEVVVRTSEGTGLQTMNVLKGDVPQGSFQGRALFKLPAAADLSDTEQKKWKVAAIACRHEVLANLGLSLVEGEPAGPREELLGKVDSSGNPVEVCAADIDEGRDEYRNMASIQCEEALGVVQADEELLFSHDRCVRNLEALQKKCEVRFDEHQVRIFQLKNEARNHLIAFGRTYQELTREKLSAELTNINNKDLKQMVSAARADGRKLSEMSRFTREQEETMRRQMDETLETSKECSTSLRYYRKDVAAKLTEGMQIIKLALESSKEEAEWLLEKLSKQVADLQPLVDQLQADFDQYEEEPALTKELREKTGELEELKEQILQVRHNKDVTIAVLGKLPEEAASSEVEKKAEEIYTPLKQKQQRPSSAIAVWPGGSGGGSSGVRTNPGLAQLQREARSEAMAQVEMAQLQRRIRNMEQQLQQGSFLLVDAESKREGGQRGQYNVVWYQDMEDFELPAGFQHKSFQSMVEAQILVDELQQTVHPFMTLGPNGFDAANSRAELDRTWMMQLVDFFRNDCQGSPERPLFEG